MRLKEIKLAGFKSFVDPTRIAIPGQVVGVVGPNGCGKSNVIDAVRWVLGESSARHLRGETMQDVIFNGAGERKPGHRATVELVFDNSLGKAAGAWSAYAEISIRRVLEREGVSEYYINGVHVRRRDVADLFLGTGVGARAYGIIEQGMISQIIEAKPEELRVFLEEAAGVSKYRERRRETELRIGDTRDNLRRVTDIREELGRQLEHLAAQAEVAERYRALQKTLTDAHAMLWLVKKQEALAQRNRLARELDKSTLEIDAETARLREAERRAETLRVDFYAANDAVAAAQGEYFQAGSDVSRLEQQLQFLRNSRARVETQRGQIEAERAQALDQREGTAAELADWRARLEQASGRLEQLMVRVAAEAERLPLAETAFQQARDALATLRNDLARLERELQVEGTRREHAVRLLEQLSQRAARLEQERSNLVLPDSEHLAARRAQLAARGGELADLRSRLERDQVELPVLEQRWREAQQAVEKVAARMTGMEARRAALEALQVRLAQGENIKAWLERHGLAGQRRLWQGIRIGAGWDDALEAVLDVRLNAIAVERMEPDLGWWQEHPPAKLAVFSAENGESGETAPPQPWQGLQPLAHLVTCLDPVVAAVLPEWLDQVFVVDGVGSALDLRRALPPGAMLVSREGHVFTRHSVSFHAPDSELHGVLSRQREIEQLGGELAAEHVVLEDRRQAAVEREAAVESMRNRIASLRSEIDAVQEAEHTLEIEILRLSELHERTTQRGAQIARELDEIAAQGAQEQERERSAVDNLERLRDEHERVRMRVLDADQRFRASESALAEQRRALQTAEKDSQEAVFGERTCRQKIQDLEQALQRLEQQVARLERSRAELAAELERFDEAPLAAELQAALDLRREREHALARVRDTQQGLETELRQTEQERLAAEQRLVPLRDRVNDLRLKEQEARLTEEQYQRHLVEAAVDQDALAAQLEKGRRSGQLNAEIARLNEEIAALGAVNLAALEELANARERKQYLDAQSADLEQALETLHNAITRIDRETRELLTRTYEEVNRHFGELFPALFGGGQARLVLTGEEILDAGVQVIAQPPGKRNSSIHLLSGGEKALTALALVFSMFQLNPAPFCLLDEVDAPLDDSNTMRFCELVKRMARETQFVFISHNKLTMEIAEQLIGVTMQELGVSRVVAVDIEEAMRLTEQQAA